MSTPEENLQLWFTIGMAFGVEGGVSGPYDPHPTTYNEKRVVLRWMKMQYYYDKEEANGEPFPEFGYYYNRDLKAICRNTDYICCRYSDYMILERIIFAMWEEYFELRRAANDPCFPDFGYCIDRTRGKLVRKTNYSSPRVPHIKLS